MHIINNETFYIFFSFSVYSNILSLLFFFFLFIKNTFFYVFIRVSKKKKKLQSTPIPIIESTTFLSCEETRKLNQLLLSIGHISLKLKRNFAYFPTTAMNHWEFYARANHRVSRITYSRYFKSNKLYR